MRDRSRRRFHTCDRRRSLLRKINVQRLQRQQHSPSLSFDGDASSDSHAFQHPSIPIDMGSSSPNLDRRMDDGGQSTPSVVPQACHLENLRSTWSWGDGDCTDTPTWDSGMDYHPAMAQPAGGRVIIVKWGNITWKVGIDGSADTIKDAIRGAFGLRSKRSFWVEDEDGVVRSFDHNMPQTVYMLHINSGVTIKLYHYDNCSRQTTNSEDVVKMTSMSPLHVVDGNQFWSLALARMWRSIQDLRPMASYHCSDLKGVKF